ncbi:alpha/beta hydrolase [candidate division GN15 bacterium]|nr:alpha/beta hydrolase [candidate division GN15 bacterium]
MTARDIYCISGLGADERVFKNVDLPNRTLHHVRWIDPREDESLAGYVGRLSEQVAIEPPPVLLGVSFGGVVALEMSRLVSPALTILVSSVREPHQIPWYYRWAAGPGLHKLTPVNISQHTAPIIKYFNGVITEEDEQLLEAMIIDTDTHFSRWAVDRLLHWSGCDPIGEVVHVHGTADRLLPIRYVAPDIRIEAGTHLMVINRAGDVSRIIETILTDRGL